MIREVEPIHLEPEHRAQLFLNEARRWVGVQEFGGNNCGQLVEIFLRGSALPKGNPWCLAFAQFCVAQVDAIGNALAPLSPPTSIPRGGHVLTVWRTTPPWCRLALPEPGTIAMWQKRNATSGHAGIVTEVLPGGLSFRTIEGNTSPGEGYERDGDGVFPKLHSLKDSGDLELLGFARPWGAP